MENTTNYNLNKPGASDNYDVLHQNNNMDLIDSQMKANADAASTAQSTADAAGGLALTAQATADAALPKAGGTMTGNLELKKDAARITLNRASGGVNQYAGIAFKDNDVEEGFLYWDFTNNKIVHITPSGVIYDVITSVGGQAINGPLTLNAGVGTNSLYGAVTRIGENTAYKRMEVIPETVAGYNGGVSIRPADVPGSGSAAFRVDFADKSATGNTAMDVTLNGNKIMTQHLNNAAFSDANTITVTGVYSTDDTWTGSPIAGTNGDNQGYLQHFNWIAANTYAMQIHTNVNGTIIHKYRVKVAGLWSAWLSFLTSEGAQTIKTSTAAVETALVLQNTIATIGGRGNEIRWKSSDTEIAAIRGITSGDRFGGSFGFYTKESAGALKANLSILANGLLQLGNGTTHGEYVGNPEGSVTAPVGSTRYRTDGGAGTTHYVKEIGTGNTGWAAK